MKMSNHMTIEEVFLQFYIKWLWFWVVQQVSYKFHIYHKHKSFRMKIRMLKILFPWLLGVGDDWMCFPASWDTEFILDSYQSCCKNIKNYREALFARMQTQLWAEIAVL